ncbi:hypothetical protein [Cronobacter sp. JZ38]|uniref:hypothetical protein n=1 Tax=Cronobacter sp. JZ38 TaxID=1906275 RepID=UPI00155711EA|nr:hypothetical protein [Cronobacter sp. JZ38]
MNKISTAIVFAASIFSLTACGETDPDVITVQDTKPGFLMGDTYKEGFANWKVCDSVDWEKTKDDVTWMYQGRDVVKVTCNVGDVDDYADKLKEALLQNIANNPDKSQERHYKEVTDKITDLDTIQLSLYFLPPNGRKPQPYIYTFRYTWNDGKSGLDTHRPQGIARDMQNQKKTVFDLMFNNPKDEFSNRQDARAMATIFMAMRKEQ